MQDRMQSGSKLLDLAYGAVFGTLFPLFLFAARKYARVERAYAIADQVINAFAELRPKYLDAVRTNLAQVTGLPADHPRVRDLAMQVMRQHAYAWVDFFYYGQRDPRLALERCATIEGLAALEEAHQAGRGAILLTAHAGSFELGGLLLRSADMRLYAVYKPDRFAAVERLRTRMRARGGVEGIPVGGQGFSTLPLLKVLREGKVVGMQGDRDFNLTGLPLPFFGRTAYFPRGPWELAAMTGAPIFCTFFYGDETRRFHVRFSDPIHVDGDRARRREAIESGMRRYVAILEDLVRRHPDQWYCFYPFWDDPLRSALPPGGREIPSSAAASPSVTPTQPATS